MPKIELADTTCAERLAEIRKFTTDPADYLYKSCRCAVAHAYSDPTIDPDNVAQLRRLSSDLPLIRFAAQLIIKDEMGIPEGMY